MWVRIPPGSAFSLKGRSIWPSQVVLLYCLALFDVSELFNHVRMYKSSSKLRNNAMLQHIIVTI